MKSFKQHYLLILLPCLMLLLICLISSCSREVTISDGNEAVPSGHSPNFAQKNAKPETFTNPRDGAELVFVSSGVFYMGATPGDKMADIKEKPLHKVFLEDYYIYRYEVTRGQFKKFTDATGYVTTAEKNKKSHTWRTYLKEDRMNLPVPFMSWTDADAYCRWAGGHLPTEAQWEKAARGTDRRIYPWGNKMNIKFFNNDIPEGENPPTHKQSDDQEDDIPVDFGKPGGSFPEGVSPYGAMDMVGSVFEFCNDWFGLYRENFKNFAIYEPLGPESGQNKIMKGGGNCDDLRNFRISNRDIAKPDEDYCDYGFRMAMSPEEYDKAGKSGTDNLVQKDKTTPKERREIIVNLKDNSPILLFPLNHSPQKGAPVPNREGICLNRISERQYGKFLRKTGYKPLSETVGIQKGHEEIPVLLKYQADAESYCRWAGGNLPDETGLKQLKKIIAESGNSIIKSNKMDINSFEFSEEWIVTRGKSSGKVDGNSTGKSFRVFFPGGNIY